MPSIWVPSFDQVQPRWVSYRWRIAEPSFLQSNRSKKFAAIHPWWIRHELNLSCNQCKWNTLGGKLSWRYGPCDPWFAGHIWDSYRIWLDNVLHSSFCCSWCSKCQWWVHRIRHIFQLATMNKKIIFLINLLNLIFWLPCNLFRKLADLHKWETAPWVRHCRRNNACIWDDRISCRLRCNRLW